MAELLVGTDHFEMTDEDRAWLNIAPVGCEFGSPDFERLSAIDDQNLEANRDQIIKQWKRRVKKHHLRGRHSL